MDWELKSWNSTQVGYYDLAKWLSQSYFFFSFLLVSFSYIGTHEILSRVRVSIVYK